MSNLAHKQRQYETYQPKQTEVVRKGKRFTKITLGEKILGSVLIVFISIMAVQIITAQAGIYEVNKDIEDLKMTIQDQQRMNGDLEMQVSDMSKYERIWKKAKEQGLNLDENNVRVVEKK